MVLPFTSVLSSSPPLQGGFRWVSRTLLSVLFSSPPSQGGFRWVSGGFRWVSRTLKTGSLSVSFSNIELFVNGCGRGIPCGCPNRDDRIFTGHPQEVPLRKSHTTLHPQRSRQSCQYSYHYAEHLAPYTLFLVFCLSIHVCKS